MGAQELIVVLIALAAGGYLLRGWIVSARQGRCGGCGWGQKMPSGRGIIEGVSSLSKEST